MHREYAASLLRTAATPVEWQLYASQLEQPIDLSFQVLSGSFRDYRFENCDFTSAILTGADFDGAQFKNCTFDSADLRDTSFVDTTFETCTLNDAMAARATFRRSAFTASSVSLAKTHQLRLVDVTFDHCPVVVIDGTDLELSTIRIARSPTVGLRVGGTLRELTVLDSSLQSLELLPETVFERSRADDSTLELLTGHLATIQHVTLRNCELLSSSLDDCVVAGLDLSGSRIIDTDTTTLGLSTARLRDSFFDGCRWSRQKGRVTVFGRYVADPDLMREPVQDVRGIPIVRRREIADAQYIDALWRNYPNPVRRSMLRFWGGTCSYGQSPARLALFATVLVMIHTVALLAARGQLVGTHPDPELFASGFVDALGFFFGGSPPDQQNRGALELVALDARMAGLLVLGIWVTVAARQVMRLATD